MNEDNFLKIVAIPFLLGIIVLIITIISNFSNIIALVCSITCLIIIVSFTSGFFIKSRSHKKNIKKIERDLEKQISKIINKKDRLEDKLDRAERKIEKLKIYKELIDRITLNYNFDYNLYAAPIDQLDAMTRMDQNDFVRAMGLSTMYLLDFETYRNTIRAARQDQNEMVRTIANEILTILEEESDNSDVLVHV